MIVGSRLLQESLAALLEREGGVAVVGLCSPAEAVAMARERSADVVVMELPARGRPAPSYVPALLKLEPALPVILIGRGVSGEELRAALELGVDACVSEEGGSEQLMRAMEAVRRSERYVGSVVSETIERRAEAGVDAEDGEVVAVSLTPREREVLALIAQAKTERQIAGELGVSPKTVHTHRTSIMHKLRVHNVIALVRRAVRLGLAEL